MNSFRYAFIALMGFLNMYPSYSQPVTSEEAKLAAKNFFAERTLALSPSAYDAILISRISEKVIHDTLVYYVCNFSSGGFVVLPAQRSVRPVIGYALKGSWYEGNLPCNFKSWMGHYEEQLLYTIRHGIRPEKDIMDEWDHLLTQDIQCLHPFSGGDVAPMLVSTWNQDYPYNFACPVDPAGPHGHCLAGCVATAMGQLMYYYRWPQTGTGSYTYIHPDYGEISADFGNTTYRWDEMNNAAIVPNTAMAELLFHIGISVDMDYGPNGSGMWNHKAAYSYKTFFKFAPETQYVYRDSTSMDWDSLVTAHLDRAMPCYYAGWADYTYTSGHAFIVDGYQGDYFHMNWGWGGSYDGYFLLDNLTPGGSNFNYAQELIINSYPDTLNYTYPSFCAEADTLHTLAGSIDDGSGAMYAYQPGTSCSWLIDPQTQDDSVTDISLSFHRFRTSAEDVLNIYDGPTTGSPLLGSFSGYDLPAGITSGGNTMLITFTSDDTSEDEGWFATYMTNSPVWCNGIKILTEDFGSFTDGSGSFDYHNNSLCQWRIMPPGADHITLEFISFETEESQDIVKVYDLTTQTLLGQFSGSTIPGILSCPSGKALVIFTSDDYYTADGWEIAYETYINSSGDAPGQKEMIVYPVPAREKLMVRWMDEQNRPVSLELLNLGGQAVLRQPLREWMPLNGFELDLSGITSGCYLLKIETTMDVIFKKVMVY